MIAVGLVTCALTFHVSAVQLQVARQSPTVVQFQAKPSTAMHQKMKSPKREATAAKGALHVVPDDAPSQPSTAVHQKMKSPKREATASKGAHHAVPDDAPNQPSTAEHVCESGEFQLGDGIGGSEIYVGSAADYKDCLDMVKQMAPDANGATVVKGGGGCYAEIGMTGIASGSSAYLSCKFKSGPQPQPTAPPAGDSTADDRCVHGEWLIGDGSGLFERYVGSADDYEGCLNMVKEMAPDANGATVVKGGGGCYAEIGMTGVASGSTSYLTCQVKAPPKCGANTGQCLDAIAGQYINPATIYEPATSSYDKLVSSGWQFDPAENSTWSFQGTGTAEVAAGEMGTMSYTFYNTGSLCITVKNNHKRGTVLVVHNGDTLARLKSFSSQTITQSVSPGDKLELSAHGSTIMQISSWSFTCPA